MVQYFILRLFVLVLLCSLTSCGKKVPDGMPLLRSCSIKILNDGEPVPDAVVQLTPIVKATKSMSIAGTTDKNGVAYITTTLANYTGKGVPEGTYKVVVRKTVVAEHTVSPAERAQMPLREQREYYAEYNKRVAEIPRIVPDVLTYSSQTPLEIEVADKGCERVVELKDYQDE